MRDHGSVIFVVSFLSAISIGSVQAQPEGSGTTAPAGRSADRSERRLFQRFVEDAVVSTGGWVELQYRYENFDDGSRHVIGPVVAFKITGDLEGGVRFGWEDLNPDSGPTQSGFTDIDLFAKYRFGGARSRTAVGALVKIPTADEDKGLGTGSEDIELFGAWRADLEAVSLTANAGFRYNGDPDSPLPEADNSLLLGGAILLPTSPRLTIVIEASYETERIHGADDDLRLTLGVQRQGRERHGGYRGAVAVPLSDGAPDYQLIAGIFLNY
jgi:hypothetical protein